MERLYENIKNYFDNTLKSKFEDITSKNHFPLFNEELSKELPENFEDNYVTFFAVNTDLKVSKKKLSKFQLNHPQLRLTYYPKRIPDFHNAKNTMYSSMKDSSLAPFPSKPMFLFNTDLQVQWRDLIFRTVNHWMNTLFSETMLMYEENYNITLALFIVEFYIETPERMYITKFPTFEDLIFVSSNNRKKLIDTTSFLNEQVEVVKNSPLFKAN